MAEQTLRGKAFEFATLRSLSDQIFIKDSSNIITINETPSFFIARDALNSLEDEMKVKMLLGAEAAVRILLRLEPFLINSDKNNPLFLSIQEDSKGKDGDVRDVLAIRKQNSWGIGISCKHNHSAVKHSRLSQTIDFGAAWLECPCSSDYFNSIKPVFNELTKMKKAGILWKNIDGKTDKFYKPTLVSFINEINRLEKKHGGIIPTRLIQYLLGRKDFYKIITNDHNCTTRLQAFNLNGSLNKTAGKIKPQIKIQQLKMPNKILEIDFEKNSQNTILIVCDESWTVSLRIHNASSKVEPSLKFDVNLKGTPTTLYTHDEPW